MKCPHCNEHVSVFSPSVNSWSAAARRCPHCKRPVQARTVRKVPFMLALSVAFILIVLALVFQALGIPLVYSRLSALAGIVISAIAGIIALYKVELVAPDTAERT